MKSKRDKELLYITGLFIKMFNSYLVMDDNEKKEFKPFQEELKKKIKTNLKIINKK